MVTVRDISEHNNAQNRVVCLYESAFMYLHRVFLLTVLTLKLTAMENLEMSCSVHRVNQSIRQQSMDSLTKLCN